MEFLRLCSFQNLSGDNLLRFKVLVNDERMNVNKTCQDGLSPLDILCYNYHIDNNFFELVQLLLKRDHNVNSNILLILLENTQVKDKAIIIELVKVFIERGCDVNAKNRDGCTPLVKIIRSFDGSDDLLIHLFNILVDAGADVTTKDSNGCNLLHWFLQSNRDPSSKIIDLIRYLIEKGVDVNARNISGENPLHIFCRLCTNEETLLRLVQLFKENGIDLRAETKQGKTARFILRFECLTKFDDKLNIEKVIEELST